MPRRRADIALLRWLPALLPALCGGATADAPGIGRQPFVDRRDPPAWQPMNDATREQFALGQLVFNSAWVAAGHANAQRRDGLGPLYVSASCDGCHNNGARGRRENSFVMQLGGAASPYGAVLNTASLPDLTAEGQVRITWTLREGRYPDGTDWQLRQPHYALERLLYGPPPAGTVLRPRTGPAIFGAGLLEAVADDTLRSVRRAQPRQLRGQLAPGRFGWQAEAVNIEDQTARAFAREMGLTSRRMPQDDCSAAQRACRALPQGGTPEVSDEFLDAVRVFQQQLAVPARARLEEAEEAAGRQLFSAVGCHSCHLPSLPVQIGGERRHIDAYTDLLRHDLGEGLADRRMDGRIAPGLWRTAPLWGLAHALQNEETALLHDGRARSIEEAILWHDGQAQAARRRFEQLPAAQRALLLRWVGSL